LNWIFMAVALKATFSPIRRTSRVVEILHALLSGILEIRFFDSPGAGKHCCLMIHASDKSDAWLLDRRR